MGATFQRVFSGYGFGLSLLTVVAAGALLFTYLGIRTGRTREPEVA
jgi:NNP family nitrate/nitrite transporter-like MFS transporter